MEVLVVYESVYGNTHAIADAIADGARTRGADVVVKPVSTPWQPTWERICWPSAGRPTCTA